MWKIWAFLITKDNITNYINWHEKNVKNCHIYVEKLCIASFAVEIIVHNIDCNLMYKINVEEIWDLSEKIIKTIH